MRKVFTMPQFAALKDFIASLPERFERDEGKVIYDGRNQLREFQIQGFTVIVKSFAIPSIINRIAYGLLRSSKAQRSCEYAQMLIDHGIGSPAPVGYVTTRKHLLFDRSFYACLKSENLYNYNDICRMDKEERDNYLRAIAVTTARMHDCGYLHLDYSAGNLLVGKQPDGSISVEIIDLNRIRFRKIDLDTGCRNFDRLPMNEDMVHTLAQSYAQARHLDPKMCFRKINSTYKYHL